MKGLPSREVGEGRTSGSDSTGTLLAYVSREYIQEGCRARAISKVISRFSIRVKRRIKATSELVVALAAPVNALLANTILAYRRADTRLARKRASNRTVRTLARIETL